MGTSSVQLLQLPGLRLSQSNPASASLSCRCALPYNLCTYIVQVLSRGLKMCGHSCWQEAEAKWFIRQNHQMASCTDSLESGRRQPLNSTNIPGVHMTLPHLQDVISFGSVP